jgi:hypothetical protein
VARLGTGVISSAKTDGADKKKVKRTKGKTVLENFIRFKILTLLGNTRDLK